MSLTITDLEDKHPNEIVPYELSLRKNSAFMKQGEVLDQDASWYVYDTDDLTTNLSGTMVYAYDYDATNHVLKADIQGGTNGQIYYLVGLATISATGRKYVVIGRFRVTNKGVAIA